MCPRQFSNAQGSVVLDVDGSSVLPTTRYVDDYLSPSWNDSIVLLCKMLDAALNKRPKQPVFADTIEAEIDTATQVRRGSRVTARYAHQPAVGRGEG